MDSPDPRYPLGPFRWDGRTDPEARAERLAALRSFPTRFRDLLAGLDDDALATPYREGGWSLRQLAHHVADSHMNSVVRIKLALTSDADPTILPYDEGAWARLPDVAAAPLSASLDLLDGLHARWTALLGGLPEEAWRRAFVNPESGARVTIDRALALYAWHGEHHLAHARAGRARAGR